MVDLGYNHEILISGDVEMQKFLMKYPFHVWLIALYFPLAFYTQSFEYLFATYFFRAALISLLIAGLLLIISWLLSREFSASALFVSLVILTFYSFPTINYLVRDPFTSLSTRLGIDDMFFWAIIVAILLWAEILIAFRIVKKYALISQILISGLNITSIVMVVFISISFMQRNQYMLNMSDFERKWDAKLTENETRCTLTETEKPDIYLIILDGYGSSEVLMNIYGYDNSPFIKSLSDLGFSVIPSGKTNYSQTRTSLSSMLNMDYQSNLIGDINPGEIDNRPFLYMIKDSSAVRFLRENGYEIINISSGYHYTEILDADKVINPFVQFTSLEETLITSSMLDPFVNDGLYVIQADRIKNQLAKLSEVNTQSPQFVFAHIYAPHPPFVFNKTGEVIIPDILYSETDAYHLLTVVPPEYYHDQYAQQVEYISNAILDTTQRILDNSDTAPIIIIQGDHGPGLTVSQMDLSESNHFERMHILDAIYVGGEAEDLFQDGHTPVNTFRILFNHLFGCNYSILPNRSYASPYLRPYDYMDVTDLSDTDLSAK